MKTMEGQTIDRMPFRGSYGRRDEESPEAWCQDAGIDFKIVRGETPLDGSMFFYVNDEFHFATEEDLLKFHSGFPCDKAWVETAAGRHLPLESIPPTQHRPDRTRLRNKRPPKQVSAGWDPNRSLSWKQRARMARDGVRAIESMLRLYYRASPPYTLTMVSRFDEGPFLLLEFFGHRFLIFLQAMFPRIAPDWKTIPGVLGEEAERLKAIPMVVCLDPDRDHKSAGFEALEARLKRLPQWRKFLLYGREPADFLNMRGAKISHVEFRAVITCSEDFWHRATRGVEAEMWVDGERNLWLSSGDLLASLVYPDQRHLLNCNCGCSGCAGIKFGCITCELEGIMLIKMYSFKRPRLLLFDAAQYRESAIACLNQLVNIKDVRGTATTWTLVNQDYLKSSARELDVSLTYEN